MKEGVQEKEKEKLEILKMFGKEYSKE